MTKLSEWAQSVKMRDMVCQECGTDQDLHAHHIIPKAERPDLSLDVSNGKALCYRCHKKEHEKNRKPRIRSDNPRKSTMKSVIESLRSRIKTLETELDRTKVSLKTARAELKYHGLL